MKFRSLILTAICLLMVGVFFTSCEDDDEKDSWNSGAIVALPKDRVFILNEGIYGMNNASLTFYNPMTKEVFPDLFYMQNGYKLGDTAQDMIEYDDDIYIVMSGSGYIVRLNGSGVELARHSFTEEDGQPRYAVAEDGKIYVTLYSGHVARLNAKTLVLEAMVKVGKNPEQIIEEDGHLYCVNSGWGYDNRLSIINLKTFNQAEHVEIFDNPQRIIECNDHIFIQGYGAAYPEPYTYPVAMYDPRNKTYTEIGKGTAMAAYKDVLYVAYTQTSDWVNYKTDFYTYNTRTGKINDESFLNNAPSELLEGNVYMLDINQENGDIYVGITHYAAGNGDVYRFKNDGTFVEKFESGGQGPCAMIGLD